MTPNTPPTISAVNDVDTSEDTSTDLIPFTVDDAETPAGQLVVTATSSDQSLISDANILLGGAGSNRTIQVTPNADQNGSATITINVSDGKAVTSETFLVTVTPMNDDPVAVDDSANKNKKQADVTIDVLANDYDVDGDPLTVTSVTQGTQGSVVNNGDGTVTYTPNSGASGSDSFTYTISDGNGGTATATVTINISTRGGNGGGGHGGGGGGGGNGGGNGHNPHNVVEGGQDDSLLVAGALTLDSGWRADAEYPWELLEEPNSTNNRTTMDFVFAEWTAH